MKKLAAIAVIVLIISILGYGTLAYTTVEDTAVNVITSGGVKIRLVETTDNGEPFPADGIHGVYPGAQACKKVTVENTGAYPAWIRVKVDVEITLDPAYGGGEVDTSLVKLDLDTENWTFRDGFYYYNQALAPGRGTKPLFTTVKFDPAMDNRYQNSRAQVIVGGQAVQVQNNGGSALNARGWPANQAGGENP